MSNRNNVVFAVLPAGVSPDSRNPIEVLPSGNAVEDLLVGQVGFFDYNTGTSFDSRDAVLPKEFYIALGTGKDAVVGDDMTDFRKSAGEAIQLKGVLKYTRQNYVAGKPMIVNVGGYSAKCDTDYTLRIEFRNSKIYRTIGHNQFSKPYSVRTGCCDDCAEGCDTYDANLLTLAMVDAINLDGANLVTASAIARQAITALTHGTSVNYAQGAVMTAADVQALVTFNSTAADADKVYTDIQLTSNPVSIGDFCQVSLDYHKLLETVLIVSLVDGFNCAGVVTVSQYPVFAEGTGKNIMQKEYHASGWNGAGPYVASEVTGLAKGNIEYLAVATQNYTQFTLEYDVTAEGGFLEYKNPLRTIIAIPSGEAAVIAEVEKILYAITS